MESKQPARMSNNTSTSRLGAINRLNEEYIVQCLTQMLKIIGRITKMMSTNRPASRVGTIDKMDDDYLIQCIAQHLKILRKITKMKLEVSKE